MKKILIKGGEVVSGERSYFADVLIGDGKILKVLEPSSEMECDEVVDASGLLVLPGLIDAHVHLREPGEEYKEGFESGSRAALNGGVTTVLDMPNNKPPILTVADLERKRDLARDKMFVNYGFYMGFNGENIGEINSARNVPGVKLYTTHSTGNMGVSDADIEMLFLNSNKLIVVHAEDNAIVEENSNRVRKEFGENVSPNLHTSIRSEEAARVAVERACALAQRCGSKLHIAHLSTQGELNVVREYRDKFQLTCEVAPHHIFLSEDEYGRLGNFLKVNPPVRNSKETENMLKAIVAKDIDIIATDHAPHLIEEKKANYWDVPSGVPELDTLLPVLLNALSAGKISINRIVEMCCERPAEIFGLKDKGFIRNGYDADLVLVDLDMVRDIEKSNVYSKCGWSPYEGQRLKGGAVKVFVGGSLAYDTGVVCGEPVGREVVIS